MKFGTKRITHKVYFSYFSDFQLLLLVKNSLNLAKIKITVIICRYYGGRIQRADESWHGGTFRNVQKKPQAGGRKAESVENLEI